MVYLIHFDQSYKGVQHYLGFSLDKRFDIRINHHRNNTGARLMRAVNLAGISWSVVRTWPGEDGNFERKLKKRKESPSFCPVCRLKKIVFSDDQVKWIKLMIDGLNLQAGRKNFSKTLEKKMDQLIEIGIVKKDKESPSDRLGKYFIPLDDKDRIIGILKQKGVNYE